MEPKTMKNMVILKDLPSNMVEEAFVIFKDNVKIHKVERAEKNKKGIKQEKTKTKDYMVKEAEMVIKDYISQIEEKEYTLVYGNKKMKQKYKRLKSLTIFLGIFSILNVILAFFR